MMKVICASDQCEASAALWHDGQITVAGKKRVKVFIVPTREAIASDIEANQSARKNWR
jgi:hypothetical protein